MVEGFVLGKPSKVSNTWQQCQAQTSAKYPIFRTLEYQQIPLNLLYSCSPHNKRYFFQFSVVRARESKLEASEESQTRPGKALLARFALAFARLKNAKK